MGVTITNYLNKIALLSLGFVVLLTFPFSVKASQSGIVAEYALNETTGTTVTDTSGQNNTGTITGATKIAGKYNNGLNFSGTNQFVTIPDANSLDLTTGMTLQAWLKPTANSGWRTVIMKEISGNFVYGLYSYSSFSRPQGEILNNGNHTVQGTAALTLNAWSHVALTYDGSNLRYYLNGVLKATTPTTGAMSTSTGGLKIGGNAIWGEYFKGIIDEVRVYNRALTAAEITTDMNTPITPPTPDTTLPTISITAPAEAATVLGTAVPITATAADNIGVVGVQFKLDGNNLGAEDTTSPYSINWNTTQAANGAHQLTATARDAAGNSKTSTTVNVTVNNPPKLTILSPTASQNIAGTTVNISYTAAGDLTSATHAHFRLDGGSTMMDLDFDGSYAVNNVVNGSHSLVGILARVDHSEIAGSDFTVNFTTTVPDTTLPTVSLTNPAAEATVSGTLNITATAADNVGVVGVQFKVDGVNVGAEDTTVPYSVSWNTTTIGNGPHVLTATARDASANSQTASNNVNVFNSNSPDQIGQWSASMNWPGVAVHTSLLSNGKILMWDAWNEDFNSQIWDPIANTFTSVPNQGGLFCSAHTILPDGRLLVMGGHNGSGGVVGINRSEIFNGATNAWTNVPNMVSARWYPSATRLSDGRVITIGGISANNHWAKNPEIYNSTTNAWTTLVGNIDYSPEPDDEYPLSFLLPTGNIYTLAATTRASYLLNVNTATLTSGSTLPIALGSAAQYRPGKIIYAGGGDYKESNNPSSKQVSLIDFNQPTPTWRTITPMQNGRYEFNLTMAADGKVYAIGGANVASQTTTNGTTTLEMWNPDTEGWTTMASMTDRRMYHSTSLLLPDGKILSAGGGRLGGANNYLSAQLYSPPYLFKGPRPTITNAPSEVDYGQTITVETPNAQNISKVTFIPLASNTHTIDMNQAYLELPFVKNANDLSVDIPTNNNIATPGHFMLFIFDNNGVPSLAKIVKLNILNDGQPPVVNLIHPTPAEVVSGTDVSFSATATDNTSVASVQFILDGNNLGAPDTTAPYAISWDSTTTTIGSHTMAAKATDISGNTTTTTPTSFIVNNPVEVDPPIISAVTATNITTTSASINWTTDENASSQVEYGLTTSYGSSTTLDTFLLKNHTQALTGLSINTLYHYRVKSADAVGNPAVSSDSTFSTLAAAPPQTITFDDKAGQDQILNGEYPTGIINWGTTSQWYHSSPWNLFTTKSVSFNGAGITSAPFTFLTPKTVVSLQAYNGGSVSSTISLACAGNPTVTKTAPLNTITTLTTNWTNSCTTVTVGSTNAWNTNFDNLIIQ